MSSESLPIWFQFYDTATGKPTTASRILRSALAVPVIGQFRDLVKAKYPNRLSSVDAADLLVYKNKASFDKRNDEGKEAPLKSSRTLDGLGETEDEPLIIVVPASMQNSTVPPTFFDYLKRCGISQPNDQVLMTIAQRYPQQLQAVMAIGTIGPCVDLYETVKELPSSFTRRVIQKEMGISMNGPMSLEQPNILTAVDLKKGMPLYIKLLRMPETTTSHSTLSKKDPVEAEINVCDLISKTNVLGLVKCDVVSVTVHHSDGLDVPPSVWTALKMKRYMSSLTELPQLSEDWLYRGFSRILKALKAMHELNLVHMDVKPDNVFVDYDLNWDLGDFGSTREIGAPLWSFTQVFNPYDIPGNATMIPAMDYVLLCVMIAIELKKEKWRLLCGQQQNVQEDLVLEKLNSIQDVNFKEEVVELFKHNIKIVKEHLKSH